METVRKTRAGLADDLPLLGFSGAPFTLASFAIEGGSSRNYVRTKTLMYDDPGAWDALMGRLVRAITCYLNAQIAAGAQAVQLFDSWVGCLGPEDYRRYVLPHTRSVIRAVTPDSVNAALRRHVHPRKLLIVVVCTAGPLADSIGGIGGVSDILVHPYDQDWNHAHRWAAGNMEE